MSNSAGAGKPRARKPPIPLTLITGALGAGKTTLLNRMIRDERFAGTAVILNEAGAVAIDGAVTEKADEGIVSLSGGCVCCTVRGELVDALERLLRALDNGRIDKLSRVVIETAGIADPGPILFLVARHPYLSLRYRTDGIVTVVDAAAGLPALDADEALLKQVAAADRIVLTKLDRNEAKAEPLLARLRRLNPAAPVLDARDASLATALTGAFDPPADDAGILGWLGLDAFAFGDAGAADPTGFSAFAIVRDGAMPGTAFYDFLDHLALDPGSRIVRLKGILAASEDRERPFLVQGAGGLLSPPIPIDHWPDGDRRSRLTIVGKDLDRPALERLVDGFLGGGLDAPDRAALLANPLAIPGFRAR